MPKLDKPTEKMKRFADAYCGEARGSVAKAYEMIADMGPQKLKQKVEKPEAYQGYIYRQGYNMLQHEMTLKAINDVKARKSRAFWLAEEDILTGLYNEATNATDKSTQGARIQAWVWLGKHIGMFGESGKGKSLATAEANNKGATYNIINYNNDNNSNDNKIVEGVTAMKDQIENTKVEDTDINVDIKDFSSDNVNVKDFS